MIKLDAVDFSERRPEEVISFFWRSVYFNYLIYLCSPIFLEFIKNNTFVKNKHTQGTYSSFSTSIYQLSISLWQ